MPFGGFALISLFYVFAGLRFVKEFWPVRHQVFDKNFTARDRSLVAQAAFFFLLPLSVALHELGHAVAIWLFGGRVLDFGFYFFAGYVSYDPRGFTETQQTWVAFAGTIVNVLLIVIAMGLIFLKRPPLRPAFNELLLQFSLISGINALILYPLLDHATGLNGDWTQMYSTNVTWLLGLVLLTQIGIIAFGVWIAKTPFMRKRLANVTGHPAGSERSLLAIGPTAQEGAGKAQNIQPSPDAKLLHQAASRVASGWSKPLNGKIEQRPNSTLLFLSWNDGGVTRTVRTNIDQSGATEISGSVTDSQVVAAGSKARPIRSFPKPPPEDELTMALRVALEDVERWSATGQYAVG
jgi:hypothetical protein